MDNTDDDLIKQVDAEIENQNLTEMEKLRRDNPVLKDAWEKILTVRALTEKPQKDNRPRWERLYFEMVEGATTSNEALREAWDQYYTLKSLITMGKGSKYDS